jgi:hypothetical protein
VSERSVATVFFSVDLFSTNIPTTIKVSHFSIFLCLFCCSQVFDSEARYGVKTKDPIKTKILEQWNFPPLQKMSLQTNNAE